MKEKLFRNKNKIKVYVAVYVCMSTKVAHSDNVTNFVGANPELKQFYEILKSIESTSKVQEILSEERITWKFIRPKSPHFGGLWKATVKVFRQHLERTVGDTLLTFKQLDTRNWNWSNFKLPKYLFLIIWSKWLPSSNSWSLLDWWGDNNFPSGWFLRYSVQSFINLTACSEKARSFLETMASGISTPTNYSQ